MPLEVREWVSELSESKDVSGGDANAAGGVGVGG